MKVTSHKIIAIIISLLVVSCADDDSTFQTNEINEFSLEHDKTFFRVTSNMDTLKISPSIISNEETSFDYQWMYYREKESGVVTRFDTISFEKDLEYFVQLKAGNYGFVFQATDVSTGITKYKSFLAEVQTSTSRGWYILKELNGDTELDLYNAENHLQNLISTAWGRPLLGKPNQIGFSPWYNWLNKETNKKENSQRVLIPMSEEEMFLLRYEDLEVLKDFKSLFYEEVPEKLAPNFWITTDFSNWFGNNGQVFQIHNLYPNTGMFGVAQLGSKNSKLSNHYIQIQGGDEPLLFDETNSTFVTLNEHSSYIAGFKDKGQRESIEYPLCRNMNADLLYLGRQSRGYDSNGTGIALLKNKTTDELTLGHFELSSLTTTEKPNPLYQLDNLNSVQLHNASSYAVNRDYEFLYYGVGSTLRVLNFENYTEDIVLDMPEGEDITYINHYQYDASWGEEEELDPHWEKLVLATFDGVNYRIYLYDLQAGAPVGEPEIIKGTGKVKHLLYMSPYLGQYNLSN